MITQINSSNVTAPPFFLIINVKVFKQWACPGNWFILHRTNTVMEVQPLLRQLAFLADGNWYFPWKSSPLESTQTTYTPCSKVSLILTCGGSHCGIDEGCGSSSFCWKWSTRWFWMKCPPLNSHSAGWLACPKTKNTQGLCYFLPQVIF